MDLVFLFFSCQGVCVCACAILFLFTVCEQTEGVTQLALYPAGFTFFLHFP